MIDFTILKAGINLFVVDFVKFGFFSAISDISEFVFDYFLISIFIFVACLWIDSLIQITYTSICNIFKTSKMFFVGISIAEHFAAMMTFMLFLFVDMFVEIFCSSKGLEASWTLLWPALLRTVFE